MNKRKSWSLIVAPGLAALGLLLAFVVLGWGIAGAAPHSASPPPDTLAQSDSFTVSGTVTCEGVGTLSEVEVFVWDREEGPAGFVGDVTDGSGYYSVTLEDGNYDLIFHPLCGESGCASNAYKGVTGPADSTLNVVLSTGHTISGTVTDGTNGVEGVSIYAFNHNTADGFGLPLTDDGGHYCIGLIKGTYDLGFSPPPCQGLGPKTMVVTLSQDMPLDVPLPPGFTVAGRVTDGAGGPVSGVQIYARECYTLTGYGFSPSNIGGYFTGTLPLGTYGIQFLPPADQGFGPKTITDVVSASESCPNASLDVVLPVGVTLSGQISCQRQPVKNVFVYADPVGPSPDCYGLDGVGVYSVDDGSFALPLIPGTYDIRLDPPPATGLNELVFTDVQILNGKYLTVDLCPFIYLPIVMKGHPDSIVVKGKLRFYTFEGGCWVIEDQSMGYELLGGLADEIGLPENDGREIIAWGQLRQVYTICMAGRPFEVVSYEFLD